MLYNRYIATRVLLVLPQHVLDRARVVAGKAMIALELAVRLQIVFQALIEQGLRRRDKRALFANVAGQALAIHQRKRNPDRTPGERLRPARGEQATGRTWDSRRGATAVRWVVVTVWASVVAAAFGCAQPAPAGPETPVHVSVATGGATKKNVTAARGETSDARAEADLKVTVLYLYLLVRSR